MSREDVSSNIGLVFQKEAQIQGLWAVYTAVQFTMGGFGLDHFSGGKNLMPLPMGLAVLLGVWVFNLGHLSMILKGIAQIELLGRRTSFDSEISEAHRLDMLRIISGRDEAPGPWGRWTRNLFGRGYFIAIAVHLFIDICASVALLSRVAWR